MFVVQSPSVPSTGEDVRRLIEAELRRRVVLPAASRPVEIVGEFPNLKRVSVDLSGGTVDKLGAPPMASNMPKTVPGARIESLRIRANPLRSHGVEGEFMLSAANVTIGFCGVDENQIGVAIESADDGSVSLRMSKRNLEAAVLKAAQAGAASSGVAIQKVDITLVSIGPCALDVSLNITAKKFVTTVIRVTGRLTIDDNLNAVATDLNADGDGMVGSIAVGFIRPQLLKIQGKPVSLTQLSLGGVRLRDIAVTTDDGLTLDAKFGGLPR